MESSALGEWKKYWTLPIAAAIGNWGSVLHIYGIGVFVKPLQEAFDWNRTQVFLGMGVANIVNAAVGILVGMLIDRWGSRRVGLIGIFVMGTAFSLLGTATGSMVNWIFLWVLVAVGISWVQPTIWARTVSSRFDKSRGLALAVMVSGAGVAASVLPIGATWAIDNVGWRYAFLVIAGSWLIVALPVLFVLFRGNDSRTTSSEAVATGGETEPVAGISVRQSILSLTYLKLMLASILLTIPVFGLIPHFVSILGDAGLEGHRAAAIAGLIGLASIAGRFGAGYLIDRFPAHKVAVVMFCFPALAAACLIMGRGDLAYMAAAIMVGFSVGGELDLTMYLTTRHFGLRNFGVIFATLMASMTISVSLAPVIAGLLFDGTGSYVWFLSLCIPISLAASLLIGSVGVPREVEPATA